jgi:Ni2+-binding GTPase involved in maturation of urease and hydrogenase
MRLITVAGPPSSGKTAVTSKALLWLANAGWKTGAIKIDCLSTDDDQRYEALGIPSRSGLAGSLCPDHYFASNLDEMVRWASNRNLDLLVTESAGLCNRCSPHVKGVLGLCVVDCLGGISTPRKLGPMLKFSDIVVMTKGDLVSQAEREVFLYQIQAINPKATVMNVNGLTGQGTFELGELLRESAPELELLDGKRLRFPMPAALCSYCLGETRLGQDYQVGNLRKLELLP